MADPLTVAVMVGTTVGSAVSTFMARRAASRAQRVETQMDGPGDEPSLRQLVRSAHESGLEHYKDLHQDLVHVTDRLKNVETIVNTGVESRLQALEKSGQANELIMTTIKGIDGRVSGLSDELSRASFNLHLVANVSQVKLLTREEAKVKRAELLAAVTAEAEQSISSKEEAR